jgi:threonine/homoserine/homoserine lactone efflux protein
LLAWTLPAIASPLMYLFVRDERGRRFGFRSSPWGWLLMSHMAALAFLAVLGLARLFVDDGLAWHVLRVGGFVVLIGVTWWWCIFVGLALRDSRRERRAATPPPAREGRVFSDD